MTARTGQPRLFAGGRWKAALDAALAAACYLLAYRVRFSGEAFRAFLPHAVVTLPLVLISQMATLVAFGVYREAPALRLLSRLAAAMVFGTAVAALLVWRTYGLAGVSRAAFSADLLLFAFAAAGWRTAEALWQLRSSSPDETSALVDRATMDSTLGETIVSLVKYRELVKNLVLKDLKLKYRGSVLGFLWSLVNPLVMIAVYTVAFTYIIRNSVPAFVFFLMLGTLAWSFFTNSASMATGSIIDSGSLMKSVQFPRAILPIATVLFNLAQYLLTVLVFLPVMLAIYRVPLSAPMLVYPIFLALQVLFTMGVALILATGTTFFRDVRHLLEIALSMLFWMTPILYPVTQVDPRLRLLLLLSPLSPFIVAYQQIFYYRQWPELTLWVVGTTYALGTFLFGAWLFLSTEDRLAEQL